MGNSFRQSVGSLLLVVIAIVATIVASWSFRDAEPRHQPAQPGRQSRAPADPMHRLEESERLGVGQALQSRVDATYSEKLDREAARNRGEVTLP